MWVFSVKIAIAHSVSTGSHRRVIKRGKWFGICSLKEEIVAKTFPSYTSRMITTFRYVVLHSCFTVPITLCL